MTKQITIVTNDDDWQGLYIDGSLVAQDHTLRLEDVLEILGFNPNTIICDYGWLFERGYLPTRLNCVVLPNEED